MPSVHAETKYRVDYWVPCNLNWAVGNREDFESERAARDWVKSHFSDPPRFRVVRITNIIEELPDA